MRIMLAISIGPKAIREIKKKIIHTRVYPLIKYININKLLLVINNYMYNT